MYILSGNEIDRLSLNVWLIVILKEQNIFNLLLQSENYPKISYIALFHVLQK